MRVSGHCFDLLLFIFSAITNQHSSRFQLSIFSVSFFFYSFPLSFPISLFTFGVFFFPSLYPILPFIIYNFISNIISNFHHSRTMTGLIRWDGAEAKCFYLSVSFFFILSLCPILSPSCFSVSFLSFSLSYSPFFILKIFKIKDSRLRIQD